MRLPKDMIIEIFLSLDIRTLRRVFFVCKKFKRIIKYSRFMKNHILDFDPCLKYVSPHMCVLFKPSVDDVKHYLYKAIEMKNNNEPHVKKNDNIYSARIGNVVVYLNYRKKQHGMPYKFTSASIIFYKPLIWYEICVTSTIIPKNYTTSNILLFDNILIAKQNFTLLTPIGHTIIQCKSSHYKNRYTNTISCFDTKDHSVTELLNMPIELKKYDLTIFNETDTTKILLCVERYRITSGSIYINNSIMDYDSYYYARGHIVPIMTNEETCFLDIYKEKMPHIQEERKRIIPSIR